MSKSVRLLNQPEDYSRIGVKNGLVEKWEDQRREFGGSGHWEWWYFDSILEDGTAVVIQFFTKGLQDIKAKDDHPFVTIKVTLPDGKSYEEHVKYAAKDATWGEGSCNVQIGNHLFQGDLENYKIYVDPINGLGANIELKSLAQAFRPGTSYFGFGDNDEQYFTWLCAVPKGEVSGTITVEGQEIQIYGAGYHDHQWGSCMYLTLWNHWLWARQGYDDYSLLVYDMVSSKKYGYKRFPVIFIEDKNGNIVFQSTDDVKYEVLDEYYDEKSGKYYPKSTRYIFSDGQKQVEYTVTEDKVLENTVPANDMPLPVKLMFKTLGLHPSYSRYQATGKMKISENGKEPIEREGQLIYEFMYPGKSYKENI